MFHLYDQTKIITIEFAEETQRPMDGDLGSGRFRDFNLSPDAFSCIIWRTLKEGAEAMEVHFTPDVQAKLDQMARDAGRQPAEVIEDAVIGLYDELAHTREMLDRRYDEMESGKVQGIDGEEAYRRLMEKTQASRSRRPA
jgi:predicted transcriptional regulator